MRRIQLNHHGFNCRTVLRVATVDALAGSWQPNINLLVQITCVEELAILHRLLESGITNVAVNFGQPSLTDRITNIAYVADYDNALHDGDVVAITPGRDYIHVLYRESDQHHTVFLTNRCNSNCLMCSQPPTRRDDSWLIDEAITIAAHIRTPPPIVGLTGGEPLLLGLKLREVLRAYTESHSGVSFDILTNARRLSDREFSDDLLSSISARCTWMVPLYGHADFLHDYIVQSHGAFDETIDGLLTLHAYKQQIQLRIVLIEPTIQILPDLCNFIGRNLPFVREVALMGCEPTGFALANRDVCQLDMKDHQEELLNGIRHLNRFDVPVVLMNLPLCVLPRELWLHAHKSISDWKQTYAVECDSCAVRAQCSGLFSWYTNSWKPTNTLTPIRENML